MSTRVYTGQVPDTPPAGEWAKRAACQDHDADLWFPPPAGDNYAAARRVCRSCTVRMECLKYAMWTEGNTYRDSRYGMWGGLSPEERARLHHQNRKEKTS